MVRQVTLEDILQHVFSEGRPVTMSHSARFNTKAVVQSPPRQKTAVADLRERGRSPPSPRVVD